MRAPAFARLRESPEVHNKKSFDEFSKDLSVQSDALRSLAASLKTAVRAAQTAVVKQRSNQLAVATRAQRERDTKMKTYVKEWMRRRTMRRRWRP